MVKTSLSIYMSKMSKGHEKIDSKSLRLTFKCNRRDLKRRGVDRRLGDTINGRRFINTINGRIQPQIFLLPLFQLAILLPPASLLYGISAGTSSQRGVIGLDLLGLRAPRFNVGQSELVHRREVEAQFVFSICGSVRENLIGIRANFHGCSQDLRDGKPSLALRLVNTGAQNFTHVEVVGDQDILIQVGALCRVDRSVSERHAAAETFASSREHFAGSNIVSKVIRVPSTTLYPLPKLPWSQFCFGTFRVDGKGEGNIEFESTRGHV